MNVIYRPQGRAAEYAEWALRGIFTGCPHCCAYCFASRALRLEREEFHSRVEVRKNFLKRLDADLRSIKRKGGWPEENGPVLLCFTCDPLPCGVQNEHLQEVTYEVLAALSDAQIPVTLLTKNGAAAREWINGWHLRRDEFATSIVFTATRTGVGAEWEGNAPNVPWRWYALREAHDASLRTWVSVEPVIDPDEALAVIRRGQELGVVGHYKIGPLNHHPHAATVDWPRFGEDLARVLVETGARYYLKQDMRRWMPEGFPPDNREEAK